MLAFGRTPMNKIPMTVEESDYIRRFGRVITELGYMTGNVKEVYDVNGNLAGYDGLELPKSKSWIRAVLYAVDTGDYDVKVIAGVGRPPNG